jgi:hypothetical protein
MQAELARIDKVSKSLNTPGDRRGSSRRDKASEEEGDNSEEGSNLAPSLSEKSLLSSHTVKHLSSKLMMEDDYKEKEKILLANRIYSKMKNWNRKQSSESTKKQEEVSHESENGTREENE